MNETLRRILRMWVPPLTEGDVKAIITEFEAAQKKATPKKKSKGGKR